MSSRYQSQIDNVDEKMSTQFQRQTKKNVYKEKMSTQYDSQEFTTQNAIAGHLNELDPELARAECDYLIKMLRGLHDNYSKDMTTFLTTYKANTYLKV
jgi:hypothetical protein